MKRSVHSKYISFCSCNFSTIWISLTQQIPLGLPQFCFTPAIVLASCRISSIMHCFCLFCIGSKLYHHQTHTHTHTHTYIYIYMSIININYLLNCNIQIVQDTVIILSLPPSKRKKKSGSNIEQWA